MPFCHECGSEVQATWKFCPNCNSSIQGKVIVQDGVIAGDVNISENTTNITNIGTSEVKCPQCSTTGNITLHLCAEGPQVITPRCHKKICNLCREKNGGVCNICVQAKVDNQNRKDRERQAKAQQMYLDSLTPKELNRRNTRLERKAKAEEESEYLVIQIENNGKIRERLGYGLFVLGLIGFGVEAEFPNFLVLVPGMINAICCSSLLGGSILFIYSAFFVSDIDGYEKVREIRKEESKEEKKIRKIFQKLDPSSDIGINTPHGDRLWRLLTQTDEEKRRGEAYRERRRIERRKKETDRLT